MLKYKQIAFLLMLTSGAAQATDDALIKKGEYLAVAADCTACHTAEHGKPFAGGNAIASPVGEIIATNITPSKTAGIGDYSERQFADALRKGIRADGAHLYPAMPYTAYATFTDDDVRALYAYFMSGVPPVDQPVATTHLPFPLSLRFSMMFWNALFLKAPGYTPDLSQSDSWNRGRYLVDGAAHCSSCHTPRGFLMQEKQREAFTGAQVGPWFAPDITASAVSGIGQWSQQELITYLKTGHLIAKAQAAGSMAEAITHSFQHLTDNDLAAIAEYMASITHASDSATGTSRFEQGHASQNLAAFRGEAFTASGDDEGARLYSGNCASCHGASGEGSKDGFYPSLFHNSATGEHNPANLIATILYGVQRHTAAGDVYMPPFGAQANALNSLNDAQIATLSNWLLHHYGNAGVTVTSQQVAEIRRGGPSSPLVLLAQIATGVAALGALALSAWLLLRRKRKQ